MAKRDRETREQGMDAAWIFSVSMAPARWPQASADPDYVAPEECSLLSEMIPRSH